MRRSLWSKWTLIVTGISFAVLTACALSVMLFQQRPMRDRGGCAFADGLAYCRMASGHRGISPWSHRPLVPFVARLIRFASDSTLLGSFTIAAVGGFVLTVAALAGLGYVIVSRSGIPRDEAHLVVGGAVVLWSVTPFALRFVLTAPVLTDELATGLLILWLALLLAPQRNGWTWTLAPIAAVLATTAREAAVATIVVTCLVTVALRVTSRRDAFASCAAAGLALVFDLTRPASDVRLPGTVTSTWLHTFRHWLHDPRATLAAFLMGTGFALFALCPTVLLRVARSVRDARFIGALLPACLTPIALSIFTGSDLPRLSSPATPVLCLLLSLYVVRVADAAQILLLALGAGIVIARWMPFEAVTRSTAGYVRYFYGRNAFSASILTALAVVAIAVAVLDLRYLRPSTPRVDTSVGMQPVTDRSRP